MALSPPSFRPSMRKASGHLAMYLCLFTLEEPSESSMASSASRRSAMNIVQPLSVLGPGDPVPDGPVDAPGVPVPNRDGGTLFPMSAWCGTLFLALHLSPLLLDSLERLIGAPRRRGNHQRLQVGSCLNSVCAEFEAVHFKYLSNSNHATTGCDNPTCRIGVPNSRWQLQPCRLYRSADERHDGRDVCLQPGASSLGGTAPRLTAPAPLPPILYRTLNHKDRLRFPNNVLDSLTHPSVT